MSSPHQNYENLLQRFYEMILRPGDTAIDIGAHSGRHTSPMAKAVIGNDETGHVFAFEPIPLVQKYLLHRLRIDEIRDNVVTLMPCALSDFNGVTEFVVATDRPEESGLRERRFNGPTAVEKIQVEVRCLDDCDIPNEKLSFIKIDCEGAEYSVLRGGHKTISAARPIVAFEFGIGSSSVYGVTPDDMFSYFDTLNYCLYDITGAALNRQGFGVSCNKGKVWDYIALPAEQQKGVEIHLRLSNS